MAQNKEKNDGLSMSLMVFAMVLILMSCYWLGASIIDRFIPSKEFKEILHEVFILYKDYFMYPFKIKAFAFILIVCSAVFKTGKRIDSSWKSLFIHASIATALYFIPTYRITASTPMKMICYMLTTFTGMGMVTYYYGLMFRKMKSVDQDTSDVGFKQNDELITTKDSINIPYEYYYRHKKHKGWINCINPYRASMILGSPGSGKSFAIYNAFIEQCIRKNFTMFLYDYKFPDLTDRVITEIAYQTKYEGLWKKGMPVKPHLYIINFDDPMKSNRCNPIHHSYITDPADTSEIADLVFKNINKGSEGKGFDFFNESAKVFLDALIWFLANYDPDAEYDEDGNVTGSYTDYKNKGKYCTFPHVIELMAYNYMKTFQILQFTKGLEAKISPFSSALEGGAMEQLQGQIASAQIPMGKFVSPALYWVMTGDDFTLDINNPEDPKIVCMGNNPDRQSIYGTTLALYTSRMFKLINHKHKLKSVVLLDELPTIFIKGLDNLIATARSNKVAIALGAQDKSQLRRDYGDKEAEVIMTTVGNVFSGSVEGRTAEDISKSFGKEQKKKVSITTGDDSDSSQTSYQLEDLLPASKIMDMTQGTFCGWVKDNFGQTIEMKKFYGAITVDVNRNKKLDTCEQHVPIITKMFGDYIPEIPETDAKRLSKIFPDMANNPEALKKQYINELVRDKVNENFKAIKEDVRRIVETEYERTKPFAKRYKAEREMEEDDED